jgi:hypothetical protein
MYNYMNIIIVISTAVLANVAWGYFIDPWLDSRPQKSIFILPRKPTKKD